MNNHINENQGGLMPNLSGLPGPKPFIKRKVKMENNKLIKDIISKTSTIIGGGNKFGDYTNDTTNEAFFRKGSKKHGVLRIPPGASTKPRTKKPGGPPKSPAGGEVLVKIGPDSSRNNPQYTRNINASYYPKTQTQLNENIIGGIIGSYLGRAAAGRAAAKMGLSPALGGMAKFGGETVGWSVGDRLTTRRKKNQG